MEYTIMDAKTLNGLSLAYIGDAVYEIYVRKHMINLGYTKVNALHKHVIKFTSGGAQAEIIHMLINENILTEDEISIYKRGRNSSVNTSRKNISLREYLDATGFESLIGYLYLDNQIERLEEIISIIFNR
jgi:ribonuclease-3 family protein